MGVALLGVGFAVLAAVALAVQSLAVRVGSRDRPVAHLVAVVVVVNALVVVPVALVVAYPRYDVTVASLLAFAAAGVVGSLLARVAYFVAIARIGASRTEPLKALFPVVAVAVAVLVLDERVTVRLLAGVATILAGSTAVLLEAPSSPVTASGRLVRADLAAPLCAALLLGLDPIVTKVGLAAGTPALVGVAIRIVAAGAGFGLYLLWRGIRTGRRPRIDVDRWVLAAGLANTAYLLAYYAALARTPVSIVTPVVGTSTLLVVVGAAVFLPEDERVTWTVVAGAVTVVAGTVLVVQG